MTKRRLYEIVERLARRDGSAPRATVKEVYGAGFEGAVEDAAQHGLVEADPEDGALRVAAGSHADMAGE